jgi:proteasome lid subunit RPN8/RPN11
MIYLKDSKIKVQSPLEVAKVFQDLLALEDSIDQEKEHYYVMHLDTRSQVKMVELVTIGVLNSSVVHPRETYRRAVIAGSTAIIIAHNHPSGEVDPSDEDTKVTRQCLRPETSSELICSITLYLPKINTLALKIMVGKMFFFCVWVGGATARRFPLNL